MAVGGIIGALLSMRWMNSLTMLKPPIQQYALLQSISKVAMQNDVLGYYPEYWKLNTNLGFQPPNNLSILPNAIQNRQWLRNSLIMWKKVKLGSFQRRKTCLPYVTNPDQAEVARLRRSGTDRRQSGLRNIKMSG